MYNLYAKIAGNPNYYRQLNCRDSLITMINCQYSTKYENFWSDSNYIVYIMDGRRVWHTSHGSYELQKGSCVFVRKGACIVEHFTDSTFCVVVFFVPDEFICEVLKSKSSPIYRSGASYDPVMAIDNNEAVHAFFHSMLSHFDANRTPDASLLELKFRELILTIADNPENSELLAYFCALLQEPQSVSLQRVMEDNYCFNLGLEEFARLSARSLSAFKRDFQRLFNTSPGKWLIEKRLDHALHLLTNMDKSVSDTAFESGFESPSHFSRAFRQRFGSSPLAIKQQVLV
ncbi:helix-turn-helix domain-containing protein [Paraflavitalea soli]|uniref:Helix-turn-helix domain-containing protein n=1 Tax=Paraflavitalea soli TaxID=2315862 RepID=A0A3B7N5J5_9BACT|nr:AraC family transcriptional regulator [Paraflavitalea soli]AXY77341.1 helix-turn-helix domain-containing protein [Paraflavitalea soli]